MQRMLTAAALATSLPLFGALQAQAFDVDSTAGAATESSLSSQTSSDANLATQAWYLDMMLESVGDGVSSAMTEMGEQMLEEAMPALLSSTSALAILREGFTTVTTSGGGTGAGDDTTLVADNQWVIVNRSFNIENNPAPGPQTWQQGNTPSFVFNAQSGSADSFVNVNFASAQDDFLSSATVDNYLLTPELDFSLGGTFSFWTRAASPESVDNRSSALQVLLSQSGASTDIGAFTTVLTQIGNLQSSTAYPQDWQQFTFTIGPTGGTGRIAFRFFSDEGQAGVNGTQAGLIGIDTVSFDAVPEPTVGALTPALAALGLVGGLRRLRRRRS